MQVYFPEVVMPKGRCSKPQPRGKIDIAFSSSLVRRLSFRCSLCVSHVIRLPRSRLNSYVYTAFVSGTRMYMIYADFNFFLWHVQRASGTTVRLTLQAFFFLTYDSLPRFIGACSAMED